jgi:hypothetical protein
MTAPAQPRATPPRHAPVLANSQRAQPRVAEVNV